MKILIVRLGALGDTVFATAAISAIQTNLPENTQIDWLGAPLAHPLFKLDTRITKVFSIKYNKIPVFLNSDKKFIIAESKKAPYDLIINLENHSKFFSLVKQIHATHKVGAPFTDGPVEKRDEHAVEAMLRVTLLGLSLLTQSNKAEFYLPTITGSDYQALEQKHSLPEKYILLHPGNSHITCTDHRSYRAWPLKYWQELAQLLIENIDPEYQIIFIGSENEQPIFDELEQNLPAQVVTLCGKTNLVELITLIQHSRLLITTDSGPSHVASAVNAPVLALFGPSDYRQTGPYSHPGNQVEIVSLDLDCSPCSLTGEIKNCNENRCMLQQTPELLLKKVMPYID